MYICTRLYMWHKSSKYKLCDNIEHYRILPGTWL